MDQGIFKSAIINSLGLIELKGDWNANTNTPTLASGVGNAGDAYLVSVAGATNLDGITTWSKNDIAWFGTDGAWHKIDNTDLVTSVFTRTGAVVAQGGDYNATQVGLGNVSNIDNTIFSLPPFFINGNGFPITPGVKGDIEVPHKCNIIGYTILIPSGGASTFTVSLWKDIYADYPPLIGDAMTGFISIGTAAAIKAQDLAVTAVAALKNDIVRINVDANDNALTAAVFLYVVRT